MCGVKITAKPGRHDVLSIPVRCQILLTSYHRHIEHGLRRRIRVRKYDRTQDCKDELLLHDFFSLENLKRARGPFKAFHDSLTGRRGAPLPHVSEVTLIGIQIHPRIACPLIKPSTHPSRINSGLLGRHRKKLSASQAVHVDNELSLGRRRKRYR